MKQGHITFKFKCENQFDTIKFQGESITLNEVKKLVAMNRKLGYLILNFNNLFDLLNRIDTTKEFADYDFKISDYQSKQGQFLNFTPSICNQLEYIQENQKIPQNTQLLVERIKLGLDKPIQYAEKDQQQQKCVMSQPSTFATKNEYLCKICNNYLQTPILTSCCTESACKICYDEKLKTLNGKCFFCNQIPDRSYVINQALQNILTKILSQNTQNQSTQQIQTGLVSIYDEPYRNEDNELEEILNNAKYFIMKSVNQENIQIAYQHQEWSTTLYNQQKLIEAFSTCKNVILLYSVNKSGRFAGFARMDSPVQQYQSQFWKDKDFIKLGGVFKIKWIKFCSLEFYKIQNFKNPLNQNEPIKKSRDAQEIPADIGKKICKMFNEEENEVQYQPTYYQNYNQQQSYWPCNYQQQSFGNQINKGQLYSNQQFNVEQTMPVLQQIEEQQEQVPQNETKQTQLLDLYEDIQPAQSEKQQNNDKLKENLLQLIKLKEQKQLETASQVLQKQPEETIVKPDLQQNLQQETDKKTNPTLIDPPPLIPQPESTDYFNLPYQDQAQQQPVSHKQSMDDSLSNQNKQLFPGQTPPPPPFNYNQFMPFPPQLFSFYNQFNYTNQQQSTNMPLNMGGYFPPGAAAAVYPPFMTKQKQEIESNDNSSNSSDSQTKKKSRKHKKSRKDKEKDKERDRRKHKSEHRTDRDSVQKKVKKH